MRKLNSASMPALLLAALTLPARILPALAQDPPAPAMPKDPNALILLAAQSNGLSKPDLKPWHLKATFQFLDDKGNPGKQGAIEEFWAGPHKTRITYTTENFSQTLYLNEHGLFRIGDKVGLPELAPILHNEFVEPVGKNYLKHPTYDRKQRTVGNAKLDCITPRNAPDAESIGNGAASTYCLDIDQPILRISLLNFGNLQAVHNQILAFQGQYIPREVRILRADKSGLTAHLDTLELLPSVTEADFTPPPDAVPVQRKIGISAAVAQGNLIYSPHPHYPELAKYDRISGRVVLAATISKAGLMTNLKVLSGDPLLSEAALDAVQQWKYRPYLLNGEPVEVETTINVDFTLRG